MNSYFKIFNEMVKDDNKNIAISTNILNAKTCPQGGIIEVGVEPKYSSDVQIGLLGLPNENMRFMVFVNKNELEKYKSKQNG